MDFNKPMFYGVRRGTIPLILSVGVLSSSLNFSSHAVPAPSSFQKVWEQVVLNRWSPCFWSIRISYDDGPLVPFSFSQDESSRPTDSWDRSTWRNVLVFLFKALVLRKFSITVTQTWIWDELFHFQISDFVSLSFKSNNENIRNGLLRCWLMLYQNSNVNPMIISVIGLVHSE